MSFAKCAPLLFVLVLGCGKKGPDEDPETARRKQELNDVFELYRGYTKRHEGQPPKQLADLTRNEDEMAYPLGARLLREGAIVAVWGVSGNDAGTVLAYPKSAPTEGGFVLMADGSVTQLSADELKSKLK